MRNADESSGAATGCTRRRFLWTAGATAAALAGCRKRAPATAQAGAAPIAEANAVTGGHAGSDDRATRVVIVRDETAISRDGEVNADAVQEMLDAGMRKLTGLKSTADTWARFFGAHDAVALKLSCLPGPPLSTHPGLTDAIVAGLKAAGLDARNIVGYDMQSRQLSGVGYDTSSRAPRFIGSDAVGYESEVTQIRSVGTWFSRVLTRQCTALINVPVLKDHDLAGISGALKSHFGSISNPNKLHFDIQTHVADLNCARVLRDKQRLIVYDALLVCYDGGPAFKPSTTVNYGAVLLSTDPVAADTVGLGIIERLREANGLPALSSLDRAPTHIALAAGPERGIGTNDLEKIEVVEV